VLRERKAGEGDPGQCSSSLRLLTIGIFFSSGHTLEGVSSPRVSALSIGKGPAQQHHSMMAEDRYERGTQQRTGLATVLLVAIINAPYEAPGNLCHAICGYLDRPGSPVR
jgi:hypothetical protein